MQTLNYSAQAVMDIREFAAMLGKEGMPCSQFISRTIADRLEQSIKFILPDGGYLFDDRETKQATLDLLHLPYPCIAAEYYWGATDKAPNEYFSTAVPKRIALAWDTEAMGESDYIGEMMSFLGDGSATDIDGRGVVIWPVDFLPEFGGGKWVPGWCGVLIPTESILQDVPEWFHGTADMARSLGMKVAKKSFPQRPMLLGEVAEMKAAEVGDSRKILLHFESAISSERTVIMQLCSALNCANIRQEIIPAPKALNKKRAKKGKPPFFEYRVLTLDSAKTPQARHDHQGGSHSSPRIHLRRGHIRRLPQKAVWVQPCVVGNKKRGVVVKDYAVTAGHAS